jgi:hypothetical protein
MIVLQAQMSRDRFILFQHLATTSDLQYSRHSVINHCDRLITLLSGADISFGQFDLFTYLDVPFA